MAWSLDGHNSTGQVLSIHVLGGACVCRGHGGSYSALFPHPPPDIKANSDSGGLWHRGPLSTQETKHGAASLHRIKQSLNASSCYTLPNETFMKGPLMWFQKHLVISPRAAECGKCGCMNEWALAEEWLYEWRCLWFYWPACTAPILPVVSFTVEASDKCRNTTCDW